jgi:ATP-dependent DNA helicase RecG
MNISIRYLKGIGPKRSKLFEQAGIRTVEDLLYYFPRRYEDRTKFLNISQLESGSTYTVKAEVLTCNQRTSFRRRGFSIIEVVAGDASGKIFCVWFNQPYLKEYFKVGQTLILYGKVEEYAGRLQMNSPEFELVSGDEDASLSIGRIVPVYSVPKGMTQRYFRALVKHALDTYLGKVQDALAFDLRAKNNLLNLAKSLLNIHFPQDVSLQQEAYRRLSFEEFFLFQLPLALRKIQKKEKKGIAHQVEGELVKSFVEKLPFTLTMAQQKVIAEIKSDMARPLPMQRLLQGDVGSGKTVVATVAALIAIQGGYQAAFMVPTEILAKQHYEKIKCQVSSVKCQDRKVKVALLTGSSDKKEKEDTYKKIEEGKINLIIGTHALLEEGVKFKRLGLVVIDEQHKFGVGQRSLLPVKGPNPDILIMTATPIPRTLAITLYGDLDVSVINELPPGRGTVKTTHFSQRDKSKAYALAQQELGQAHQAYVIYPVIEESYALDIAGAKKMYLELSKKEFRDFKVGLIHGRLKEKEQDKIMAAFKKRELDVLVATTVLEVGIDMPFATCMLIEHAERFGLAQLHQLRGRVGRGADESFCLLVSDASTAQAQARLSAMVEYSDGFKIAEEDLKIRGPGEFFGRRQHGLSELRIANPLTQLQLLKKAREEAIKLVAVDPRLCLRQNLLLRQRLLQRFPEYEELMLVA